MKNIQKDRLEYLPEGLRRTREYRGLSNKACASLLGIPTSRLRNYENGKYTPSLPEIESLSFIYKVPITSFFDAHELDEYINQPEPDQLQQLIEIRKRIIQTNLQIAFEKSGKTYKDISERSGISTSKIKRYLTSAVEIPLNELLLLKKEFNLNDAVILDSESPVGRWQENQKKIDKFFSLPANIQKLVVEKENHASIEVAEMLNKIGCDRLEELAAALDQLIEVLNQPENLETQEVI